MEAFAHAKVLRRDGVVLAERQQFFTELRMVFQTRSLFAKRPEYDRRGTGKSHQRHQNDVELFNSEQVFLRGGCVCSRIKRY